MTPRPPRRRPDAGDSNACVEGERPALGDRRVTFEAGLGVVFVAAAMWGGCLTAYAPDLRAVEHHAGLPLRAENGLCLSCHEAEQAVLERLDALDPQARHRELDRLETGGGASIVAQWMIEDRRACVQCHRVRGGAP